MSSNPRHLIGANLFEQQLLGLEHTDIGELSMYSPGGVQSVPGEAPLTLQSGLSAMASLYQTSTNLLGAEPLADIAPQPEYTCLDGGVPSVGESYCSSPSPGMQDPYSPVSPNMTPAQRQLATVGQPFYVDPHVCTLAPQGQNELLSEPESPLGLELNEVKLEEVEQFVQEQLRNDVATSGTNPQTTVHIKREPEDEMDSCGAYSVASSDCHKVNISSTQQQKRRGGRPRDPVPIPKNGVPSLTVIKKERRKEQNRRAARKCREKKKVQTEQVMSDYFRMQQENTQLMETVADLKRKLSTLKNSWRAHAAKCPQLSLQPRQTPNL